MRHARSASLKPAESLNTFAVFLLLRTSLLVDYLLVTTVEGEGDLLPAKRQPLFSFALLADLEGPALGTEPDEVVPSFFADPEVAVGPEHLVEHPQGALRVDRLEALFRLPGLLEGPPEF